MTAVTISLESPQPDSADEAVLDINEREETFPQAHEITYFGTDFDVHGLVRRLNQGDIVVPSFDPSEMPGVDLAGFQRGFVWQKYQMDRFIESLLLGYPVPGIFLVQQSDRKLLVLDGQQRLKTLQAYYKGRIGKEAVFKLESVSDYLKDLAYEDLDSEQRRVLDDTFIHATIVKYDSAAGGDEAVYQVFERLNAGGTNLYPHEIRVALYHGELVSFIRDLNQTDHWRHLYGSPSPRLKDQELILRFISLFLNFSSYKRPLKGFLNAFLKDHQNMQGLNKTQLKHIFEETCSAIHEGLGKNAFRPKAQINAALVDSLMCGIAHRLSNRPFASLNELKPAYDQLISNDEFISSIARATADEDRVQKRLALAKAAFLELA
jgi:hypothetical protein